MPRRLKDLKSIQTKKKIVKNAQKLGPFYAYCFCCPSDIINSKSRQNVHGRRSILMMVDNPAYPIRFITSHRKS